VRAERRDGVGGVKDRERRERRFGVDVAKWASLVKTSAAKELQPTDADWWYVRAAAIARRIYLRGTIGVGAFKRAFGSPKNNGARRSHFAKASGNHIRTMLQQLEKLGVVEQDTKGGRKLTSNGRRDLDRIARQIAKV